jgi:ribosome-binding factor A
MHFKRADRVADLIKADISEILSRQARDPRIRSIVITDVKMTDDLRLAKIFYCEMGKDTSDPEVKIGLDRAKSFLKRELAKKLQLRYVPDLAFITDNSFAYGSHIDKLLAQISDAKEAND